MQLTSFNLIAIKRLETYLGIQPSDQLTPDTLSEKIQKKLNLQNNYNPFNNYDSQSESIKQEIRSLITEAEKKYNSDWKADREKGRVKNEGRIAVGTGSLLPDKMKQFKDSDYGNIVDRSLPGALDMVAETLQIRRTSRFKEFHESGFDEAFRKSPEATKSLISNGLNYLVKYPIMAGLGGFASVLILTESSIRGCLYGLSCLSYGALEIAEKVESTSVARKFYNNEFAIQGAKESVDSVMINLRSKHYTLGFINRNFFSKESEKSDQNKESSHDNDELIKISGALGKKQPFNYKSPDHGDQSFGNDSRKRKRGDQQDSGPDQKYSRITKSARGSSYFDAFRSGDTNQLKRAEDARFDKEIKFQEMKEAKRKEREEAKQKAKNTRQPKHASSFPSTSASPKPLIDTKTGRLGRAPLSQTSPFTRNPPSIPPASNEYPNTRSASKKPGSNPRQPLTASQPISRRTGIGAPHSGRY